MLAELNEEDGTVRIEFGYPAEPRPVIVYPPTLGGFKRLRADQARISRQLRDEVTAIQEEAPELDVPEDASDEEVARLTEEATASAEKRLERIAEARQRGIVAWWRVVLVGDESYRARVEGSVPDDPEDWPAALIYDYRPAQIANGQVTQDPPFIDRVMLHWGKVLSPSGRLTAQAG